MSNESKSLLTEDFQELITLLTKQNADLVAGVDSYAQRVAEARALLDWYEEQFRLNQCKRFGASSQRTNIEQLSFLTM